MHLELFVPHVRLGSSVPDLQLVPVLEVGVLDVLGQPVHGKVHVLGGNGVGHPGEGLE